MTSSRASRFRDQLLGLLCVAVLLLAHSQDWPTPVRLPLALVVFFVVPGLAVVTALRLRADRLTTAALVVGLSVSADFLGARLLLVGHVASVTGQLIFLGGLGLLCMATTSFRAPVNASDPR